MAFWIIVAFLTLAACLAVLLPAVSRRRAESVDADFDLAVYQDQLAELDRDVARGGMNAGEAKEARAEIGRRILKLAGEKGVRGTTSRAGRLVATIAVLSVPLASWGIYAATGSPHLPGQPLQARLEKNPAESTVTELIARAQSHLAANPGDGRGWEVLAPIYDRIGRHGDAATAWRNAIRLLGPTADREVSLAVSIAAAQGGAVGPESQLALQRALMLDESHPRARFLIGLAHAQEGRRAQAEQVWQAMLADLPEESPWRNSVQQALGEMGTAAERPGPTAQDVEDAGLISDNEQAEMIANMVAGLDRRLSENPDDPEGWRRLVQSYVVLGRIEEASGALDRGLDALGRDSEAGAGLLAFAASRGVSPDGATRQE